MILFLSSDDRVALRRIGDELSAIRAELHAGVERLERIAVALEGQPPPREVTSASWRAGTPQQEG